MTAREKQSWSQKEARRRKPSDWRATSSRDDLLSHMLLEQLTAIIGLDVTGSSFQVRVDQPRSFCTGGIQLDDFLWIAWIGSLRSVVRSAEKTVRSIRHEYKGNRLTCWMLDYIKIKSKRGHINRCHHARSVSEV